MAPRVIFPNPLRAYSNIRIHENRLCSAELRVRKLVSSNGHDQQRPSGRDYQSKPNPSSQTLHSLRIEPITRQTENGIGTQHRSCLTDANSGSRGEMIQANRSFLAMFEGCPELRADLGKNDTGRRLLHSLDRWLALGRPDPVFGRIQGQRSEWVPLFEDWVRSLSGYGSESYAYRKARAPLPAAAHVDHGERVVIT